MSVRESEWRTADPAEPIEMMTVMCYKEKQRIVEAAEPAQSIEMYIARRNLAMTHAAPFQQWRIDLPSTSIGPSFDIKDSDTMADYKVVVSSCFPHDTCPKVARRVPQRVIIVGTAVTDPDELLALGVGSGEAAVEITEALYRDGYDGLRRAT